MIKELLHIMKWLKIYLKIVKKQIDLILILLLIKSTNVYLYRKLDKFIGRAAHIEFIDNL